MSTSVIDNQTTVVSEGDIAATVMRGIADGQFTSQSGVYLVGPDGLSVTAANVPTAVAVELAKSMIQALTSKSPLVAAQWVRLTVRTSALRTGVGTDQETSVVVVTSHPRSCGVECHLEWPKWMHGRVPLRAIGREWYGATMDAVQAQLTELLRDQFDIR